MYQKKSRKKIDMVKNQVHRFSTLVSIKKSIFLISQSKHNVVGTQKNRLTDGSFKHPKHMLKLMGKKILKKKYLQLYADNFCVYL